MDEFLLSDDDLPYKRTLHNWCIYNSDSRFISLELLPMKPCPDLHVRIFGSGVVTRNDSESSTQSHDPVGIDIHLNQIKQWMIEVRTADMVSFSLRTDMAWYRLGKPSKQYEPWFKPVMKTTMVGILILAWLKNETRVAKLSYRKVIKRLCELEKNDKAYISRKPLDVERYVIVNGQIILHLFEVYPDKIIKRCPFILSLAREMQDTKWIVKKKKKKMLQKVKNLNNPRVDVEASVKAMAATTTRLINRIWGESYSLYSLEDTLLVEASEEEVEVQGTYIPKKVSGHCGNMEIRWNGEVSGHTCAGEPLYVQAIVGGEMVSVGDAVILELDDHDETPLIYLVEYMFESFLDHCKMMHGKLLQGGSKTVLGNAANERELYLTSDCITAQLKDIKERVGLEIRSRPWGHQYRKVNIAADKIKAKDSPKEYYCKSLYSPERGGFFNLPRSAMGLGSGLCTSCKKREVDEEMSKTKLNDSKTGFSSNGIEYSPQDFVYVIPDYIAKDGVRKGNTSSRRTTFNSGRNIGLQAFVVCQLLDTIVLENSEKAPKASFEVKVTRFYRPEDISNEKAYASHIQELYYSEDTFVLPPEAIKGKCEVRKKQDMPLCLEFPILDHIFFCEHIYDSSKDSLEKLPSSLKLKLSKLKSETEYGINVNDEIQKAMRLTTLDIFSGCGGLSYGLEKAGVSNTKWAIEFEEPAGEAFKQNHPEATVFVENCNVILRAVMERCGDVDECISTQEANELAAKLDEHQKSTLPLPGQVDFIIGGPPCQGFSGMNRYSNGSWSKVQCEMILAFLSFADYYRPKYVLLENVMNFVSFNGGRTFQLTLASLLEMGYQVRFGILEAGAYGVSQTRKRVFIWAASPEETLPEWPEPMHVFNNPGFKIPLSRGLHYAAVHSTKDGAPFRSITVRDTIGDLPPVVNGECNVNQKYPADPVSWFQKVIRENENVLTDHICKKMYELNLIRCKKIPKRAGANWHDLPDINVKLSNGVERKMIPLTLSNTAKSYNGWKGQYGRLDWEGNFPTTVTVPHPMAKVGMCFHPDQDRIITVRECARSQGFPDNYKFVGTKRNKHRQIGNAVPPPLTFALGRKLKEALHLKLSS